MLFGFPQSSFDAGLLGDVAIEFFDVQTRLFGCVAALSTFFM